MRHPKNNLFLILAASVGLSVVSLAQNVSVPPTGLDEGEATKPVASYDFVKDTTEVATPNIVFDYYTDDKKLPMEGWSSLVRCAFVYRHEGKVALRPASVGFILSRLGYGQNVPMQTVYLRFGSRKLEVAMGRAGTATGLLNTTDFLELSKAKEVYFKVDGDPFAYVITEKYMSAVKQLADTIPQEEVKPQPLKPTPVATAKPTPLDSTKWLIINSGEIRLNGTVRSVNAKEKTFILSASSFALPNGKEGKISIPKPKTVRISDTTIMRKYDSKNTVMSLSNLRLKTNVSVVGKDTGSGNDLKARAVAISER